MPLRLRVASFNIRYANPDEGLDAWPFRRTRTLSALRNLKSQLLCLQEVLHPQLLDILSHLSGYDYVGVGRDNGIEAGEYAPIFYDKSVLESVNSGTFWLSDSPDRPGSATFGNRIPRICTWAEFRHKHCSQTFAVYNTHLDHESEPSRIASARLILKRIDRLSPTIIAGDLNAGEESEAAALFKSAGLVDTFRAAHPQCKHVGTFCGFREEFDPAKIDYVWASRHWRVEDAGIVRQKVDGRWPSDHAPVFANLVLET